MSLKHLGKKESKRKKAGTRILDKIIRNESNIPYGSDFWNVYDFMYLDQNKLPVLKVLEIEIPSSSKYSIESKSMKLFLNEYYKKSFKSEALIIKSIKQKFDAFIEHPVKIKFIKKFAKEPSSVDLNKYKLVSTKKRKLYKFSGFRSICPVTSQPDFACIFILCDESLNTAWLKKYLMSFKEQGDFHEQCIESIYSKLYEQYKPKNLEICGRFQRRGGIDINPVRGNSKKKLFGNFRVFNQ